MNGLEKFDVIGKLTRLQRAMEQDDMMAVARVLGLTEELAEDMSVEEIFQSLAVRINDLVKKAQEILDEQK